MARRASSRQVISGYGAKLRERLAASSLSQVDLANAAGVSRQTIAQALRDIASARTVRLIDDVLRLQAQTVATPPSNAVRPRSHAWATATDLEQWSDRRDAQEDLPRLIRRLIPMDANGLRRISFRTGEGVQLVGYDGIAETAGESTYVPGGHSIWEMGTGANPASKAQEDYTNRTSSPGEVAPSESTFVFVTSRRWAGKDAWVAARKAEGVWLDVRVLDADDIEAWLEASISVHLWVSRRIGIFPDDATDLEHWWENWLGGTRPPLTADFVLAGREDQVGEIHQWMKSPRQPIGVLTESRNESIAVVAAAFTRMNNDDCNEYFSRTVIVGSESAWRHFVGSSIPLILIPSFEADAVIPSAIRAGHAVVIPLGEGDTHREGVIAVPPIARAPAVAALEPDKNADHDRAYALASLARRSMTALRRRLAVAATMHQPEWSRPSTARTIIPALLIGGWNQDFSGDRRAIAKLAQTSFEEAVDRLLPWSNGTDPALRRRTSVWYLVSREDQWDQLARYVTRDDIERFMSVAIDVLGMPDTRFDLPAGERWLAGITQPGPVNSGLLRDSIASTLAVMGTRPSPGQSPDNLAFGSSAGLSFPDTARRTIRELLGVADTDWRVWATLARELPSLAEGAPEEFLNALDASIRRADTPLRQLFEAEDDGFLSGSSPHTGILWALERLAWSTTHLGRIVRLLGELAKLDPGGKLTNRPSNSLKAIFLPWFPQTSASAEKRIAVLDALSQEEPALAWDVLTSMLPQFHGVGIPTARPQWRDWAPETNPRVSRADYMRCVRFATSTLLKLVGEDGPRWKSLLEAAQQLPSTEFGTVLEALSALDTSCLSEQDRTTIWQSILSLVADHKNFQDAEWAMPTEQVERLEALRERFAPTDPGKRHAWLFAHNPRLPDAKTAIDDSLAYEAELASKRRAVVNEVCKAEGRPGLDSIAALAEVPQLVGDAVAEAGVIEESEENDFLINHLANHDDWRHHFAMGYLWRQTRTNGAQWAERKFADPSAGWTSEQRADLLLSIDSDPRVWRLAESAGADVERAYWTRQPLYFVRDASTSEDAARKLLSFARPFAALDLIALHMAKETSPDPLLVVEILEQCLTNSASQDGHRSLFTHNVGRLLDYLAEHFTVDEMRIGRLEWAYLPAISHDRRVPKVLHRALARDSTLFIEIVSLLYRAKDEPRDRESVTEEARQRAHRAHSLLRSWNRLPGISEDGGVDAPALGAWVTSARAAFASNGRREIGDHEIGQLLSHSPPDQDGTWPCRAVREIIENIASEELEQGFSIGLYNGRGVTRRSPAAGGGLERGLAERYAGLAMAVSDTYPRTASVLTRIADGYRAEAAREDHDAALGEDLGR